MRPDPDLDWQDDREHDSEVMRHVASGGLSAPIQYTETGLQIEGDLSWGEWEHLGRELQAIGRSWQWWVGDWLRYGEHKWGEKYTQAIEATDREYSTLQSAQWVAERVELFRRRNNLSWSHPSEVAALEPEEQDRFLDEAEANGWTRNQLRDAVKHYKAALSIREQDDGDEDTCSVEDLYTLIEEGYRFGTIYADPPWAYGNQGTRGSTDDHYGTMSVEEIAAMPVESLAAESGHLHLWTTNAFLFDARKVMEAWGYEYKSCFVWVKPQMGMGNYWRVSHEYCLLGVRGSLPFAERDEMSWRKWNRGKHSSKPGQMYRLIERVSPGPYLELFARRQREGWVSWGNEIERDLFYRDVAA